MNLLTKITISIFAFFCSYGSAWSIDIQQFTLNPSVSDSKLTLIPDFSLIQSFFHENKSYECALSNYDYIDDDNGTTTRYRMFAQKVTDQDNLAINVNFNGNVFPPISTIKGQHASSVVTEEQHARLRFSVIASKSGRHNVSVVNIFASASRDRLALINCRETTLYGNFNRFYAETPVIEILNKARVSFQVQVTIVGGDGSILVNKQPHIVNANTRTDIIFNELPANTYGQVVITHTAPFGALEGVIAEYNQDRNGEIILRRERPLGVAAKS